MTKSDAIEKIMKDYTGIVTLQIIYNNIEKYYPNAKKSDTWQAGIRGVLYRDIGKRFRKIGVCDLLSEKDFVLDYLFQQWQKTEISLTDNIRTLISSKENLIYYDN